MRLLVTGTGRCGTKFMSQWLTGAGVACGHEAVFSYRGYTPSPTLVADASWLAVPYLGLVTCRIVHLVRHPLAVISSFMGTRHFGPFGRRHLQRGWYQYMSLHFGYSGDPVQDAMRYWVEWNEAIERHTDERYRIEDLPNDALLESVGGQVGAPVPDSDTNRHRRAAVWLPRSGHYAALAAMAERYGYEA